MKDAQNCRQDNIRKTLPAPCFDRRDCYCSWELRCWTPMCKKGIQVHPRLGWLLMGSRFDASGGDISLYQRFGSIDLLVTHLPMLLSLASLPTATASLRLCLCKAKELINSRTSSSELEKWQSQSSTVKPNPNLLCVKPCQPPQPPRLLPLLRPVGQSEARCPRCPHS